jgi:hypothetical protein
VLAGRPDGSIQLVLRRPGGRQLTDPTKLLGVVVGQPAVSGVVRVEPVVQHGDGPLEPPRVAPRGDPPVGRDPGSLADAHDEQW